MTVRKPESPMSHTEQLHDRLRRTREAAGLTQQQVADWLGIRRPGVAEIESGKRAVKSHELARLAVIYGCSIAWLAHGESAPEDLVAAALFRAGDATDPILRREAHSLARRCRVLDQIERAVEQRRSHLRPPSYADEDAAGDQTRAYEHGRQVAYQERHRLGLGLTAPLRDPWGIVEGAGVHVLPLQLGRDHPIDGIFTRVKDGRACVGVNVDKWVFRQVFTVMHEYAHALFDADLQSELCDTQRGWQLGERQRYANRELRANQFAAVFLVPREALVWYLESRNMVRSMARHGQRALNLTPIDIVRAQDHFGVSGTMLLWRLQNENLIAAEERHRLSAELEREGVLRLARELGYRWRTHAQPFTRAYELALAAYVKGHLSLGVLADIFGIDKAEMHARLGAWNVSQEFEPDDALLGQPA